MNHFYDRFLKKIDNRLFVFFCLLVAIVNKSWISILYTDLEADKSLYLLFADTFLKTNNWLEPLPLIDNNYRYYHFNPAIYSPLYAFLAAPILSISGSFYQTSNIIDIISWVIFFTGLYRFTNFIFSNKGVSGLFILLIGFFTYPHVLASTPKDTISIGLIFWCVYQVETFFRTTRFKGKEVILTVLFLFLLVLAKFLYTPLVLAFLLFLLAGAIVKSSRHHLISAGSITSCVLVATLTMAFYLRAQPSSYSPLLFFTDTQPIFIKSWQPQNLLHFYPFISSALFNIDFVGVQLEKWLKLPYSTFIILLRIFDILLLISGILFYKKLFFLGDKKKKVVLLISLAISLAILFMLVYMSFTYKAITNSHTGSVWTYVAEERSYLFVVIFLQALFFYLIFKPEFSKGIQILLFFLFLAEVLHGIYFSIKQVRNRGEIQKEILTKSAVQKVTRTAVALQKEYTAHSIKLITNNQHLRWYSTLHGVDAYAYSIYFNPRSLAGKSKTIYLFVQDQQSISKTTNGAFKGAEDIRMEPFLIKVIKNK